MYNLNDLTNLTEREIYNNILLYNNSLQTNCETASMDLYIVISNVCYSKGIIIPSLLRIFIRPLYYLGIEKSQDVLNWIKWFLNHKNTPNYATTIKGANDNALKWFFECLNKNNIYIEESLKELQACNELQDIYFALKKDESQDCFEYTDNTGKTYCFTEFQQFKEFTYKFFEERVSKSELENIIAEEIDFFSEKFEKPVSR
ncbi:hypothetical protein A7W90_18270 [Clostridium sp. Bc-iso-3]|jgi:hypothetical protein|nr:hypothetical protein A7W90_18415 [Clostridium sp. Bc-iso-3]ODM24592.1 hypothetical protein A7W90_18435 [Clostridium sp. Bc-iso-3]ODM27988.1 hypothetical protein A7W90_18250 [Clostridium sp. Bc-iso-3]ODM27992.1 hypothetical protein A7W90_18270 [Clostridium sp. Bc-iso-3]